MKRFVMKNIYIPLIALVLLSTQCKKEETTENITLKGYVTDLSSRDTIPNIKVRLRHGDFPGIGGNAPADYFYLKDSAVSDEYGAFSFDFLARDDERYSFEPIDENYFYSSGMFVEFLTISDHDRNVNVRLYPLTWLKVRIKNEAPSHPSDSIWYDGPHDRDLVYSIKWYSPIYSHNFGLKGENTDTTFYIALKYDKAPLQYWDITENNQTQRSFAYIGCDPLDTCESNIFY